MNRLFKPLNLLLIAGVLLWQGCAATNHQKNISHYLKEIEKLRARLIANPNDAQALRNMGVICFEIRKYPPARKYLVKTLKLNPLDPKALFYLGITLESENRNQLALKVYKRYTRVAHHSPYRKLMEGRYHWLTRQMVREEMRALLKQEGQLGATQLSPKAIAVFPLVYQGRNQEFAPLGKGLSEMMITDLSQVPELRLIERIRLQALLEEMALGQTGMVDESTAPRFGKFLSAGKIVHGAFNVQDKNNLQLDVAFWDVVNRQFPDFTSKKDVLKNLFKLEKDLVFGVIDEMGIELTPQEQEKIQRIPTKNMQAFIAYCMGLEKEDAGQFEAAAKFYQRAIKLDPNFEIAGQKAETSKTLSIAGGSKDEMLATVDKQAREAIPTPAGESLVSNRLQNLSNSIGSNFVPGQDSRESAEEASESGVEVFGDLPLPPERPHRR